MSSITVQTSGGTRVFHQPGELYAEINRLYQSVNQSNEAAARAYFALGELLVKSHAQMLEVGRKDTLGHIMAEAGVHHRKGHRAIKWYKTLMDEEDGSFSMHKYRNAAHEVAEAVKNGTQRARFDEQKNPSVRSMEVSLGLRGRRAQGCDPRVTTPDDDDGFSVIDVLNRLPSPSDDELEHADPPASARSAHRLVKPSENPGASGTQMTIDFDLIARERELRTSIEIVAARLAAGTLDTAHAAGIDQRMQKLTKYINSTIEGAVA